MNDLKDTRKHVDGDEQIKRVNRFLVWYSAKKYQELDDKNKEIALPYNEVLARCEVNKSTLYQKTYPAKVNTYTGTRFDGGRGSKCIIWIEPKKFLKHRGKLADLPDLGQGNWERYVFENEIESSSGDE